MNNEGVVAPLPDCAVPLVMEIRLKNLPTKGSTIEIQTSSR